MKTYLGLISFFFALGLVKCGGIPIELLKIYQECEKEVGAIPKEPPNFDDPNTKCFFACLMKKEGFLADGKIEPKKTLESAAKNFPQGSVDSGKAKMNECINRANGEKGECDVGGFFYKCLNGKHPH